MSETAAERVRRIREQAAKSPVARIRQAMAAVAARYADRVAHHRPLRVRARLVRPLVLTEPVLLDGLLRVGVAREYASCPALAGTAPPPGLAIPLPVGTDGAVHPRPAASLGFADEGARILLAPGHPDLLEYAVTWHKTWEHSGDDHIVFRGAGGKPTRGKLSVASAQYKGWAMRLNVVEWRTIFWWCRGDAEEVARVLANVPAVGKKQAYGFGLVAPHGWEVVEVGEDWSSTGPTGAPTRPLPIADRPIQPPGSTTSHCAYRSPAYDHRGWTDCWHPLTT